MAGGFTEKSLKRRSYVVYANGSTARTKSFMGIKSYPHIEPGAEIYVPEKKEREPLSPQAWVGLGTSMATLAAIIFGILKYTMSEQTQNKDLKNESKDELRALISDMQSCITYLLSKCKIIVPIGILGAIIVFIYAHFQTTNYKETVDFVVEDSKSGGGSLGGLAALAGVNLGSGGGGAFQGDNILELYKS